MHKLDMEGATPRLMPICYPTDLDYFVSRNMVHLHGGLSSGRCVLDYDHVAQRSKLVSYVVAS